ncbi:hypothetical protein BVY04_01810 [bacterium M21]|nr:hypothetical protein BVY04_01810 [bacterium M21]
MSQLTTSSSDYFVYFPEHRTSAAWGIVLESSGRQAIAPGQAYPAVQLEGYSWSFEKGRILDSFAIVAISQGEGIFESRATGTRTVRSGDAYLLFPGVWHRYRPKKGTGWTEHWVVFNGDIPARLWESEVITPSKAFYKNISPNTFELLEQIGQGIVSDTDQPTQLHAIQAMQILAQLNCDQQRINSTTSEIDQKLYQAKLLMQEHASQELNMPDLAKSLGLGYSWFRKRFKEATGIPPQRYHLQLRIKSAKHLLLNSNLQIQAVSQELGFESQFYLSRLFKKMTGISPKAFREHPYED